MGVILYTEVEGWTDSARDKMAGLVDAGSDTKFRVVNQSACLDKVTCQSGNFLKSWVSMKSAVQRTFKSGKTSA